MPESLVETKVEPPARPVLHAILKGFAFIPNLLCAALLGALLAAPISLLLFRIFPSSFAVYAQDITTMLPAFGLGYLVARRFHHSVAPWIWLPAGTVWLLIVLPDVASYAGQCEFSRTQYFLREFVFDLRTNCGGGLAWPLYTLPTLCCIGYSLGARFARRSIAQPVSE